MKKILIIAIVFIGFILLSYLIFSVINNLKRPVEISNPVRIGLSLDTLKEDRWKIDRDLFTKRVEDLGGSVVVLIANGDDKLQISQIDNFITQKVDVLVVVPHSSTAVAEVIEKAKKSGIKVISYDRLVNNSDGVDLYVTFDNEKVGEMEAQSVLSVASNGNFAYLGGAPTDNNTVYLRKGAMKVLDPKIKNGDIKIVLDVPTKDWLSEEAYKNLKNYLMTGKKVDAVVAANDGTAFGAIKALQEYGLAGKVPVSGQDAELSACQRIIAGTQTATVYKPIKVLAYKAAEIAMDIANKKMIETNALLNNGKIDVPSYFVDPILVTKDNMKETVISDGYHSYEDVYNTSAK